MKYKQYGQTGLDISVLGFGGMRFENPGDIEQSARTVLTAYEQGINYFDTAPMYCDDKSEIIMGHAIREMKRRDQPFYISTKSNKHDGTELRKDLEKSLKRLNVETIDFYHCWYVLTLEDWEKRKKGGAVAEILKAKEEGLIRHAVFSTHLSGVDARKVIEEKIFEGVTLGYSAINFPYRKDGILAAEENNMGVAVMNPLGGGMIPSNEDSFDFLKIRKDQSILDAALQFLLAEEAINVILVGFRNEEDVKTAAASIERGLKAPYTSHEIEQVRQKINQDFNSLCTGCMYCKGCPEGIEPWKFMETANLLYLKSHFRAQDRLSLYWGTHIDELKKCTQCGECEDACTQHLPIIERFELLKQRIAEEQSS